MPSIHGFWPNRSGRGPSKWYFLQPPQVISNVQWRLKATGLGHFILTTSLRGKQRRDDYPYFTDERNSGLMQLGDLAKAVSICQCQSWVRSQVSWLQFQRTLLPASHTQCFIQWEDRQKNRIAEFLCTIILILGNASRSTSPSLLE